MHLLLIGHPHPPSMYSCHNWTGILSPHSHKKGPLRLSFHLIWRALRGSRFSDFRFQIQYPKTEILEYLHPKITCNSEGYTTMSNVQYKTACTLFSMLKFQNCFFMAWNGTLSFQNGILRFQNNALKFQNCNLKFQKHTLKFQNCNLKFQNCNLKF